VLGKIKKEFLLIPVKPRFAAVLRHIALAIESSSVAAIDGRHILNATTRSSLRMRPRWCGGWTNGHYVMLSILYFPAIKMIASAAIRTSLGVRLMFQLNNGLNYQPDG
jgi:hypothetical protein